MLGYNPLVCSGTGALSDCIEGSTVLDAVVQEVDLSTGSVLFEWHAADHVSLENSYVGKSDLWDYFHINSVAEDVDGNVIISSRNTSADYKIDRSSGDVLWVFGGKSPTFTTVVGDPDPITGPDFAHHFRALGGDEYSYFDNGNQRGYSRAAVVHLDTSTNTATYMKIVERSSPIFATTQGTMQHLPGGGYFVGWGGGGTVTEYDLAGNVVFDATLGGWELPPVPSGMERLTK